MWYPFFSVPPVGTITVVLPAFSASRVSSHVNSSMKTVSGACDGVPAGAVSNVGRRGPAGCGAALAAATAAAAPTAATATAAAAPASATVGRLAVPAISLDLRERVVDLDLQERPCRLPQWTWSDRR